MSEQTRPIFHHAFTVLDIEATRAFYGGLLGCAEGRRSGNPTSSISIFSAIILLPI